MAVIKINRPLEEQFVERIFFGCAKQKLKKKFSFLLPLFSLMLLNTSCQQTSNSGVNSSSTVAINTATRPSTSVTLNPGSVQGNNCSNSAAGSFCQPNVVQKPLELDLNFGKDARWTGKGKYPTVEPETCFGNGDAKCNKEGAYKYFDSETTNRSTLITGIGLAVYSEDVANIDSKCGTPGYQNGIDATGKPTFVDPKPDENLCNDFSRKWLTAFYVKAGILDLQNAVWFADPMGPYYSTAADREGLQSTYALSQEMVNPILPGGQSAPSYVKEINWWCVDNYGGDREFRYFRNRGNEIMPASFFLDSQLPEDKQEVSNLPYNRVITGLGFVEDIDQKCFTFGRYFNKDLYNPKTPLGAWKLVNEMLECQPSGTLNTYQMEIEHRFINPGPSFDGDPKSKDTDFKTIKGQSTSSYPKQNDLVVNKMYLCPNTTGTCGQNTTKDPAFPFSIPWSHFLPANNIYNSEAPAGSNLPVGYWASASKKVQLTQSDIANKGRFARVMVGLCLGLSAEDASFLVIEDTTRSDANAASGKPPDLNNTERNERNSNFGRPLSTAQDWQPGFGITPIPIIGLKFRHHWICKSSQECPEDLSYYKQYNNDLIKNTNTTPCSEADYPLPGDLKNGKCYRCTRADAAGKRNCILHTDTVKFNWQSNDRCMFDYLNPDSDYACHNLFSPNRFRFSNGTCSLSYSQDPNTVGQAVDPKQAIWNQAEYLTDDQKNQIETIYKNNGNNCFYDLNYQKIYKQNIRMQIFSNTTLPSALGRSSLKTPNTLPKK